MEVKQKTILSQNHPNPFKEKTSVNCIVPSNIGEARLLIFNMQGTLIKTYLITGRGKTTVNILGTELNSGTYIYILVTDGKVMDSKRMIFLN